MDEINTLVLEGGGIYGIAYIGALKELQSKLDFNKIKYFCGTSVGSLISFALGLGLKAEQIEYVIDKYRISFAITQIPYLIMKIPWNVVFNYGLIQSDVVRVIAKLLLQTAYPDKKDITFKELPKDVIIPATNLTDSYFFIASKQTTPEMSVIDAVVYSCCGNIVITPNILHLRKQNKKAIIIDGGASVLNYPIALYSPMDKPCYICNMLDNDYSRDLYAQYGGKFSDFEKIMKNTTNNTLLGIKFESPNPFHK